MLTHFKAVYTQLKTGIVNRLRLNVLGLKVQRKVSVPRQKELSIFFSTKILVKELLSLLVLSSFPALQDYFLWFFSYRKKNVLTLKTYILHSKMA